MKRGGGKSLIVGAGLIRQLIEVYLTVKNVFNITYFRFCSEKLDL
jgi:hypothetical protein